MLDRHRGARSRRQRGAGGRCWPGPIVRLSSGRFGRSADSGGYRVCLPFGERFLRPRQRAVTCAGSAGWCCPTKRRVDVVMRFRRSKAAHSTTGTVKGRAFVTVVGVAALVLSVAAIAASPAAAANDNKTPVTVTVTGTQTYGGTPVYAFTATPPGTYTITGSLFGCTTGATQSSSVGDYSISGCKAQG